MTADPHQTTGLDRRDLLRLAGLIAALLVLVGVVLLAGGGGSDSAAPASGRMTGILTSVSQTRLDLRTEDGDAQTFAIRPQDLRNLDLFHLQQHSADALPSIVHYEEEDGTLYAVRVDDA